MWNFWLSHIKKMIILGIWKLEIISFLLCCTLQRWPQKKKKGQSTIDMPFTWYKTLSLALYLLIGGGTFLPFNISFHPFYPLFCTHKKLSELSCLWTIEEKRADKNFSTLFWCYCCSNPEKKKKLHWVSERGEE